VKIQIGDTLASVSAIVVFSCFSFFFTIFHRIHNLPRAFSNVYFLTTVMTPPKNGQSFEYTVLNLLEVMTLLWF
jgi:hypothetical protein